MLLPPGRPEDGVSAELALVGGAILSEDLWGLGFRV